MPKWLHFRSAIYVANVGHFRASTEQIATVSQLKQIEGIKHQALLISKFIASCERQSNLWRETRNICRLSISASIYASARTIYLPTVSDLCKQHFMHVALFHLRKRTHKALRLLIYQLYKKLYKQFGCT